MRGAVWQVRSSVPGHMLVGDTERICEAIRALAAEPGTSALAEMLDAETRACAEAARRKVGCCQSCASVEDDILARIDQRKEAGE